MSGSRGQVVLPPGGWRIIEAMAIWLTRVHLSWAAYAEGRTAIPLDGMTALGIPVSMVHTIAGAMGGARAVRTFAAAPWGMVRAPI